MRSESEDFDKCATFIELNTQNVCLLEQNIERNQLALQGKIAQSSLKANVKVHLQRVVFVTTPFSEGSNNILALKHIEWLVLEWKIPIELKVLQSLLKFLRAQMRTKCGSEY